jgi:precorrin-6B methylase 1
MVIGAGPQEKVMMPPAATAAITAAEVQLAGVPLPMTRVGRLVSTARASTGTAA